MRTEPESGLGPSFGLELAPLALLRLLGLLGHVSVGGEPWVASRGKS